MHASRIHADRSLSGTAIAPFLPVPTPPSSGIWTPIHLVLFFVRAPAVFFLSLFYFLILEHLPVPQLVRKCVIWVLLAVPGVWWVDLQVDGVKRGSVYLHSSLCGPSTSHFIWYNVYAAAKSTTAERNARYRKLHTAGMPEHLPHEGTVIASSFTSPLDPLYLAGIFCPVFTRSYPGTRKVEPISLWRAILLAFSAPDSQPKDISKLVTLKELKEANPKSIICVFPECTTTNGRGILPFSPSLLTADSTTRIYPVNLRYTPGDVTTPVPLSYASWLWKLLSKPTHYMRVRIARPTYNSSSTDSLNGAGTATGFNTNIFDGPRFRNTGKKGLNDEVDVQEQEVLDRIGEDLARLGRVKRVGLGMEEKIEFVKIWGKKKR
jgi:1-acylglycerol-3-phosphate O-acyltransferase